MKLARQAGVTIMEALIGAAIMGIIVAGIAKHLANTDKSVKDLHSNLVARQVMDQSLAQIIQSGAFFPPIGGGTPMTYVGCYDSSSVMIANKNGGSDFLGTTLADPTVPSGLCPKAKFEAHVVPNALKRKVAQIYVLQISQQTGAATRPQPLQMQVDVEPNL